MLMVTETWPSSSPVNPVPYCVDGGFTLRGFVFLVLMGVGSAILTGLIQGFLVSIGFNIFLFSAVMLGFLLGYLLKNSVTLCKVRNYCLCAAVSLISAAIVFFGVHYFQYVLFEQKFAEVPPAARSIARDFDRLYVDRDNLQKDVQQLLDTFEKAPELRKSFAVNGFFEYLDLMAHRGLRVTDQQNRGRAPERFSYTSTCAVWGAEILMMTALAFFQMCSKLSHPFCIDCQSWKIPITKGFVMGDPKKAGQCLASGDLSAFNLQHAPERGSQPLQLTLLECPNCRGSNPIEVRLESTTPHMAWNGTTTPKPLKSLGTVTYPSESIAMWNALIQTPIWQNGVKRAAQSTELELAGSISLIAWIAIIVAFLLLSGSILACCLTGNFSPTGFVISGILFLCGWGLRLIAQREKNRHRTRIGTDQ